MSKLYDLAVEVSRDLGGESSVTRAELRAVAADLRYTGGYLLNVIRRSAEWGRCGRRGSS